VYPESLHTQWTAFDRCVAQPIAYLAAAIMETGDVAKPAGDHQFGHPRGQTATRTAGRRGYLSAASGAISFWSGSLPAGLCAIAAKKGALAPKRQGP
jgi:hypothetical protein